MDKNELKKLTPMQYAVTQMGVTEKPYSGKYDRWYCALSSLHFK